MGLPALRRLLFVPAFALGLGLPNSLFLGGSPEGWIPPLPGELIGLGRAVGDWGAATSANALSESVLGGGAKLPSPFCFAFDFGLF